MGPRYERRPITPLVSDLLLREKGNIFRPVFRINWPSRNGYFIPIKFGHRYETDEADRIALCSLALILNFTKTPFRLDQIVRNRCQKMLPISRKDRLSTGGMIGLRSWDRATSADLLPHQWVVYSYRRKEMYFGPSCTQIGPARIAISSISNLAIWRSLYRTQEPTFVVKYVEPAGAGCAYHPVLPQWVRSALERKARSQRRITAGGSLAAVCCKQGIYCSNELTALFPHLPNTNPRT